MSNFRVIYRKEELGSRISLLYKRKQLSIGILDVGNLEQFNAALSWYSANLNFDLYAMTTEQSMEEGKFKERFSNVTFLVFKTSVTTGEYINALADKCDATFFLVARSDMSLIAFNGKKLMQIMEEPNHPAVIAPVFITARGEIVASLRAPCLKGRNVDPISYSPSLQTDDQVMTLYPIMEVGLYDRALFQRMRMYDTEILGEYYQAMDYGVRCNLFGYKISATRLLAFQFTERITYVEDRSICEGMNRFYTKALSIRRLAGRNVVEKWKPYVDKTLYSTEIKNKQKLLQKTDFQTLIKDWKMPSLFPPKQGGF